MRSGGECERTLFLRGRATIWTAFSVNVSAAATSATLCCLSSNQVFQATGTANSAETITGSTGCLY